MNPLYNLNGLVFWSEDELRRRDQLRDNFAADVRDALVATNPAWRMAQIEAPMLTPRSLLSAAYTNSDLWAQESLKSGDAEIALRPETTPGTYVAMRHLLDSHSGFRPPFCVWQIGKSFRREDDQPYKHMRLKEFTQMEFQCLYTADTFNDYHAAVLEPMRRSIACQIGLPTRLVPSDRLPAYSEVTMDIEVDTGADKDGKWMEICSISRRIDFPGTYTVVGKKERREVELRVLEIAIGIDRCSFAQNIRNEKL